MLSAKKISAEEWTEALRNHPEANFLHCFSWQKLHENLEMHTEGLAIFRDETIVGLLLMIVKNAKRGRYVEIPGGPLIDWTDQAVVEFTTNQIKEFAKKHHAVFARVRPQLEKTDEAEKIFAENGYKKAPMHLHAEHTSMLDLTQTEEDILKNMRQQTRYEVRKAERIGVQVRSYLATKKIDEFITMQNETAKRQGFVTSSSKFLKTLVLSFAKNAKIYVSEKDGRVLNMGLVLSFGREVDYFEASSSDGASKFPGAYGLLWRIIKDAKNDGYKRLNFWGIAYSKDPKNRYAGVTTFKRGFGGDDVIYLPAQDLIISRPKYAFSWIVETVRRKMRRL